MLAIDTTQSLVCPVVVTSADFAAAAAAAQQPQFTLQQPTFAVAPQPQLAAAQTQLAALQQQPPIVSALPLQQQTQVAAAAHSLGPLKVRAISDEGDVLRNELRKSRVLIYQVFGVTG